jgi:hypothetical protein
MHMEALPATGTTMRTAILITASLLISFGAQAAEGVACFENFDMPEYPAAALSAKIDGFVWATIQVDPSGVPAKIDTEVISAWNEAQKLLAPPVEKAIRAAKVKPECAGQTVHIDFRFILPQDAANLETTPSSWIVPIVGKGDSASATLNDKAKDEKTTKKPSE